jgi:serine/threonine-protein kinase
MAVVYRAHDQRLGREVAVKMLRPQYASDPNFVQRFRSEAQAAAQLSNDRIARVYDTGEDSGRHYIVMELLPPHTLKEEIVQRGPLPVDQALSIAIQVCQALHHAHSKQLVHRDIKPHNILFTAEGQVKVTDFGIARALDSASQTETGTILGSVHYLSPEQAQGRPATPQSDLYSLGVVLYEMLTGQPPYQGETPVAVALQHVQGRYVSTRTLNPRLPAAVDQVVQRAMARDPAQRFASAQEMLQALQRVQTSPNLDRTQVMEAGTAAPAGLDRTQVMTPSDVPRAYQRTEYEGSEPPGRRQPARPRSMAGPIAAVVAIVALCLGAFLWGGGVFKRGSSSVQPPIDQGKTVVPPPPEVKKVIVPDLVGLREEAAKRRFATEAEGWKLVLRGKVDSEEPAGSIVWQQPEAETMVDERKKTISYKISTGKVKVAVPDVTGQPAEQAEETLLASGLKVGARTEEASADVPQGAVIRQNPAGRKRVEEGTAIILVVSSGPPPPPPPPAEPALDVVFSHAEDPETGRKAITVVLQAADDAPTQHVRITASDEEVSDKEVFSGDLAPGADHTETVTGVGATKVQVYADGNLVQEDSF